MMDNETREALAVLVRKAGFSGSVACGPYPCEATIRGHNGSIFQGYGDTPAEAVARAADIAWRELTAGLSPTLPKCGEVLLVEGDLSIRWGGR